MKAAAGRAIAGLLTSPRIRDAGRDLRAMARRMRGEPALVHYFHQVDDPYSHLVLQALPALAVQYACRIATNLASPPDDTVAPDRDRLRAWSRRDAAELAAAVGLDFDDPGHEADRDLAEQASRVLAQLLAAGGIRDSTTAGAPADALADALSVSRALWRGDRATISRFPAASMEATAAALDAGAAQRRKLGHYLGATLYVEGEWYWGIDRLAHLEQRLRSAGLAHDIAAPLIAPVPDVECRHRPTNGRRPELHFFCSLRSPYTYLAVPRVVELARCYEARLRIRFVLPMVMRGLPVPREKRLYILRDTKREAERLGMPFGRIADPVGVPTERGLAVLHHAVASGNGAEFLWSFLRAVWAEGIDAGSDSGLRTIAARAGLGARVVSTALADHSWREVANRNREEMLALGLWGVPSFRVDDRPARWGQDRLWAVERDLIEATTAKPVDESSPTMDAT
jgi:2-hydroxychromene-2-carboxylate isomerase